MAADETQAGDEAQAISAELPVVEVTLLEDRALVLRRGLVEIPPGRSRLRVDKVAPVLVDKTLNAALSLPAGEGPEVDALDEDLRVRSVKIRRRRITREADRPADAAELRARLREHEAGLDRLRRQIARVEDERGELRRLVERTLVEISEDVGWDRRQRERWTQQLDELEARLTELGAERRRLDQQLERHQREGGDLRSLITATGKLDSFAAASLELELLNPGSTSRRVELRVDYLVPGAMWRPWHTARLIEADTEDSEARVHFRCAGAVWQATGEDWSEVDLIFSTERPSLGVTPPRLATDWLRPRKRSSTVEVETREQKIHTAGLGAGQDEQEELTRGEVDDELPGIDDGGEALELRGAVKATIPGDGRPYRVPIFEFESPAETALICAPERVAAVMLRSRQDNRGAHPLLAGPVDLVRNSGLVGRSSILFIAPGERFELGWGPDSNLRVHRSVVMLDHDRKLMSSWTRKPRRVELRLSNLSAKPCALELRERVAVSEIEKVEVEIGEVSRGATPDDDGFVTWELELPGFGHEQIDLNWTLVVHDDVVGL